MTSSRKTFIAMVVLAAIAVTASAAHSSLSEPVARPQHAVLASATDDVAVGAAYVLALEIAQGAAYVQAIQAQQAADLAAGIAFVQAVQAEQARAFLQWYYDVQVFIAWVLAPPPPPPGDCFAQSFFPAYIIRRESGGDPYIINGGGHAATPYASGGRSWGCFQFMPGTWSGACSDLGYDVGSQIECADRVSSHGANLRPWAL